MEETRTLPVTTAAALKTLMHSILTDLYPRVFNSCQAVAATAEDLEQTPDTRLLKSSVDSIYNAIERLFYKEKIVLFPYLEKHFSPETRPKTTTAIHTALEEGGRIAKMTDLFKDWLSAAGFDVCDTLPEKQVPVVFRDFENAWQELCRNRENMFRSFAT